MRFNFDHDYHIHSGLSSCSLDEAQTPERILAYAEEQGLSEICVTDHFWDSTIPGASDWYAPQNFAWIEKSKPLPQTENVQFLFGCETEMDKFMKIGIAKEAFDLFDFVIIPTTHMHMRGFTIPEEVDVECMDRRAALWVERLDALLKMSLPFHKIGIAHLACSLIDGHSREYYLSVLERIPTEHMKALFQKAADVGVGIELNYSDMNFKEEEAEMVLRMFRIAKESGCKFYLGSDAHHPEIFGKVRPVFDRAIDMLDLKETDKFHIGR